MMDFVCMLHTATYTTAPHNRMRQAWALLARALLLALLLLAAIAAIAGDVADDAGKR